MLTEADGNEMDDCIVGSWPNEEEVELVITSELDGSFLANFDLGDGELGESVGLTIPLMNDPPFSDVDADDDDNSGLVSSVVAA